MKLRKLIDSREKWTKGVGARNKRGRACPPDSVWATKWCLDGGLEVCYRRGDGFAVAREAVESACDRLYGTRNYISWQDSRTVDWLQVARLLNEAGV